MYQALQSDIELNVHIDHESATMICTLDKFKFAQVLRNLVSNALKFTPPGGKVVVNLKEVQHPSEDNNDGVMNCFILGVIIN